MYELVREFQRQYIDVSARIIPRSEYFGRNARAD
jgi:hypothetical protein